MWYKTHFQIITLSCVALLSLAVSANGAGAVSANKNAVLAKPFSSLFYGLDPGEATQRFRGAIVAGFRAQPDPMGIAMLDALERDLGMDVGANDFIVQMSEGQRFLAGYPNPKFGSFAGFPSEYKKGLVEIGQAKDPSKGITPIAVKALTVFCSEKDAPLNAKLAAGILAAKWPAKHRGGLLRYLTTMRDNKCLHNADYVRMAKPEAVRLLALLSTLDGGETAHRLFDVFHAGLGDLVTPKHVAHFVSQQTREGGWMNRGELGLGSESAFAGAYVLGAILRQGGQPVSVGEVRKLVNITLRVAKLPRENNQ